MDKDANPNAPAFQPFVAGTAADHVFFCASFHDPAGIPNSWAEWDNVPAQGIMQCHRLSFVGIFTSSPSEDAVFQAPTTVRWTAKISRLGRQVPSEMRLAFTPS